MELINQRWLKFYQDLFNDEIKLKKQLIETLNFDSYFEQMIIIEKKVKHENYVLFSKKDKIRDINCTKLMLKKMNSNIYIQKIEEIISSNIDYWQKCSIYLPSEHSTSYTFWFFFEQALYFRNCSREIFTYSTNTSIYSQLSKIEERCQLIWKLIPKNSGFYFSEDLNFFIKDIDNYRCSCTSIDNNSNSLGILKSEVEALLNDFVKNIFRLAKESLDYSEAGGIIECNCKVKDS